MSEEEADEEDEDDVETLESDWAWWLDGEWTDDGAKSTMVFDDDISRL